ncbi:glycosyl transferase family 90-domain-containing protein [Infundibulicybe gibba]|nr:glycosyl transferase family 90-domain-containing protein [Infundibulicybe gibba]
MGAIRSKRLFRAIIPLFSFVGLFSLYFRINLATLFERSPLPDADFPTYGSKPGEKAGLLTPAVTDVHPGNFKKIKTLAQHIYRSDGLMDVVEGGPHPLFDLISRAEEAWKKKLGRASKNFEDAVREYKRRYKRPPPKGFDDWWDYVTKHHVQLPDEYDQIFHDLEPFWGIEPGDLHKIQAELEKKKDSYTVGKNETNDLSVLTYAFEPGRYSQLIVGSSDIVSILQEVEEYLPDFRITISPHDGPNRLSDYAVKSAVLEAASSKTCKFYYSNFRSNLTTCEKTFIHDHRQAMDPCLHPNHFHYHGQYLSHNMGPAPQATMVPEFSYCSTTIHHNIRIPVPYEWIEDIYPRSDDAEWETKVDERLLWRGSNTGIFHAHSIRWENSHRNFLVRYANELDGTINVLPSNVTRNEPVGKGKYHLTQIFPWRGRQSLKEAGNYKYIIDVDGNGWSGRFKRLITSNALIFKSTIYPEWYTDRVAPWVHYVPIQIDLSDLHDTLIFFRGDPNGAGAHEALASKIALAGREWSKTFWRREDLVAYFFRLILEYSRLMSDDRTAMTYYGSP